METLIRDLLMSLECGSKYVQFGSWMSGYVIGIVTVLVVRSMK